MHRLSFALLIPLALAACGDDGSDTTGTTGTSTTDASSTSTTSSTSTDSSTSTTDEPTTGPTSTTDATSTTDTPDTTSSSTDDPATGSSSGDDTTGGVEELPPIDSADVLEAWLAGGSYKAWAAESKVHPSAGPHGGNVRTYVNAALFGSLEAGDAMHPQGAATVKELYGGGMDTITGYAVMVKLAPDSDLGNNWYWYERVGGTTYADGTGVGLCTGCHGGGADYVLTPFPLQ